LSEVSEPSKSLRYFASVGLTLHSLLVGPVTQFVSPSDIGAVGKSVTWQQARQNGERKLNMRGRIGRKL